MKPREVQQKRSPRPWHHKRIKKTVKKEPTIKSTLIPSITCYTDGSYSQKTDMGGWCAYLECWGESVVMFDSVKGTTVNRMELTAVIEALSYIPTKCNFHIYSDSAYVVNSISKRWVQNWARNGWMTFGGTKVQNIDLWKQILELVQLHNVNIYWVKGHAGDPGNELCDTIAQHWRNARTY